METMERERRPRRSFSKEFKRDTVELFRSSGKSIAEVARDLDLTESAVREWVRQADVDDGSRDGLTSAEREELARLRKENRVLREDEVVLTGVRSHLAREVGGEVVGLAVPPRAR